MNCSLPQSSKQSSSAGRKRGISPSARLIRPEKFDTSRVIKADALKATITREIDRWSPLKLIGNASKIVSQETLNAVGRQLKALHHPIRINYADRFGMEKPTAIPETIPAPEESAAPKAPLPVKTEADLGATGPSCKHCHGKTGSILYGKYGYYFKCAACDGNTSVRGECGVTGHKGKVRKDGPRFPRLRNRGLRMLAKIAPCPPHSAPSLPSRIRESSAIRA